MLILPEGLPAIDILKAEGVPVVSNAELSNVPAKPLRIGILNLMPEKITYETDLSRQLAASPLTIEISLLEPAGHRSKTTPEQHLQRFYTKINDIKPGQFDGFIITGAPLERIDFEDVDYWHTLTRIMDSARQNVRSTLYICWAAFAGLYYRYGIAKQLYDTKISGVFRHRVVTPCALTVGFDDEFYVPHSRFVGFDKVETDACDRLDIVAESSESGIYIIGEKECNDFYITGHSEYSPMTLDNEYRRDLGKGMNPTVPVNYYRNDDPALEPIVRWRSHARLLFSNWIERYVADSPTAVITARL